MNDYGKPQNDKTHQDDHAHELIEQLNLLENVDRRITPEHVAKRFRELLDDIGDGGPPSAAADLLPRKILDRLHHGDQLTGPWRDYNAEHWADLLGLSSSPEAGVAAARRAAAEMIADAQLKAKTASDELQRAQEAVADARNHAEQILAAARAKADEALERAEKLIRSAEERAARIISEAHEEAEQIITAARNQHVNQTAWAGTGLETIFQPPTEAPTSTIYYRTSHSLNDSADNAAAADQYLTATYRTYSSSYRDLIRGDSAIPLTAASGGSQQPVRAPAAGLFDLPSLSSQPTTIRARLYIAVGGQSGVAIHVVPASSSLNEPPYSSLNERIYAAIRHSATRELTAYQATPVAVCGTDRTMRIWNLAAAAELHALAEAGDEYAAMRLTELLAQRGDLERLRALAEAGDEYAAMRLAELAARSPVFPA